MSIFSDEDAEVMITGLDPVIGPGCRILIVGSFPSSISLQKREYYANPRNDFWKLMEVLFGIPRDLPYPQRSCLLIRNRIGLWDAVSRCTRAGSMDTAIRNIERSPILELLDRFPDIRCLAGNGRKAHTELLSLLQKGGRRSRQIELLYLPSSSPAHAVRFDKKSAAWMILHRYVPEL